ncbi:MAG: hypothetical protein P8J32_00185 [bacterium]|nr:hypothetical protein [bacterium]
MSDISKLPEIENLKNKFAFTYESEGEDHYHCRCGNHFSAEIDEFQAIANVTDLVQEDQQEFLEEFSEMFNDIKMAIHQGTTCPECKTNYVHPLAKPYLVSENQTFASGFHTDGDQDNLYIYHYNVGFKRTETDYDLDVKYKRLTFSKTDFSAKYKELHSDEEYDVDLCDIISVCKDFVSKDSEYVIGLHNLHHFINSLANFVPDAESIHVMQDIIAKVRGSKDTSFDELQKVLAIFTAIRLYSNLSTVAMTKGAQFLYDVMRKCQLPRLSDIREAGVTAPLDIFNFLIQNYIDQVNDDIQGEDRSSRDFIFKTDVEMKLEDESDEESELIVSQGDEKEMTIKVRNQKAYEKALQLARAQRGQKKGEINVKEAIEDGSISKFIFKRIDSFHEYEKLIRFFKFMNKKKLIALLQKHPKEFLVAIIDRIYHRRECDEKEMTQIFNIVLSFVKQQSNKNAYVDEEGVIQENLNYSAVEDFDFAYYDDAIMAIEYLYRIVDEEHKKNFVRSKFFNKIKTYDALVKFHDGIMTQQNYFSRAEEGNSSALQEVVDKYRILEEVPADYDGKVRIKILDTFQDFVAEGQEMDHSAGRYAQKTLDDEMLVCKLIIQGKPIKPGEQTRFTLGLVIDYYDGIVFDALKGKNNSHASDRVIKEVRDWLEMKGIAIRRITDIKYRGDDTLDLSNIEL